MKLEFMLKLNGNDHHISVIENGEGGYLVKLDGVETAVIEYQDNCWLQIHGSKLPDDFIGEIGKHVRPN